jgi:hypothetical protein
MNPWIERHQRRVWLGACAGIWIVVFAWPTQAPQSGSLVHPRERWSLPQLPEQSDLTPRAKSVATSPLWGVVSAPAASGAAPPEDNTWVLAGVYTSDGETRAVIRYMARRGELRLKVGDKIPSGEKILEIGSDAIWVTHGKKGRKRLPMYSLAPGQP